MTAIELWARGAKGGETVTLEFYDRNLGKPGEKDGHFNPVTLKNSGTEWKHFKFDIFTLTNNTPGKRPPDLNAFEGFMISGSVAGTVVYT